MDKETPCLRPDLVSSSADSISGMQQVSSFVRNGTIFNGNQSDSDDEEGDVSNLSPPQRVVERTS